MDVLDVVDALVSDGASGRHDDGFEESGHEWRTSVDDAYKRATWGLRDKSAGLREAFGG